MGIHLRNSPPKLICWCFRDSLSCRVRARYVSDVSPLFSKPQLCRKHKLYNRLSYVVVLIAHLYEISPKLLSSASENLLKCNRNAQ